MDRDCLAELHGNMFVDECAVCKRMFVRSGASSTVGRKMSNESCKAQNVKRPCRGKLRDFVLGTIHILCKHLYNIKPNLCSISWIGQVLNTNKQNNVVIFWIYQSK